MRTQLVLMGVPFTMYHTSETQIVTSAELASADFMFTNSNICIFESDEFMNTNSYRSAEFMPTNSNICIYESAEYYSMPDFASAELVPITVLSQEFNLNATKAIICGRFCPTVHMWSLRALNKTL